ncbi:MAG: hypothetical protein ACYSSO_10705 [Planctomycetota bacterium]|jgi:hypothetical protein
MDADKNIIPILNEDQGEGFKDPIDWDEEYRQAYKESLRRADEHQQELLKSLLKR